MNKGNGDSGIKCYHAHINGVDNYYLRIKKGRTLRFTHVPGSTEISLTAVTKPEGLRSNPNGWPGIVLDCINKTEAVFTSVKTIPLTSMTDLELCRCFYQEGFYVRERNGRFDLIGENRYCGHFKHGLGSNKIIRKLIAMFEERGQS